MTSSAATACAVAKPGTVVAAVAIATAAMKTKRVVRHWRTSMCRNAARGYSGLPQRPGSGQALD
jgi:hypothetical protein